MSKKKTKTRPARKGTPQPVTAVLHVLPVLAQGAMPDGVAVCATVHNEEGEPLEVETDMAAKVVESMFARFSKSHRSRVSPGVWRANFDGEEDVSNLTESMLDALADSMDLDEDGGDDVGTCEDCSIGDPCDAWGPRVDMTLLPRTPPPADVNTDAVAEMARYLAEADENGLLAETLAAAMQRACLLRPRPTAKTKPTMTLYEATETVGVSWPCDSEAVTAAYRKATQEAHPDHGGSAELMARLTHAKEIIEDAIGRGVS